MHSTYQKANSYDKKGWWWLKKLARRLNWKWQIKQIFLMWLIHSLSLVLPLVIHADQGPGLCSHTISVHVFLQSCCSSFQRWTENNIPSFLVHAPNITWGAWGHSLTNFDHLSDDPTPDLVRWIWMFNQLLHANFRWGLGRAFVSRGSQMKKSSPPNDLSAFPCDISEIVLNLKSPRTMAFAAPCLREWSCWAQCHWHWPSVISGCH